MLRAFLFFLLLIPFSMSGATSVPKNIILFIGDGMGIAHLTAGKIIKGSLNLEEFKHIGLLMTHSQDALVTDSAASATAMATGYKTRNGFISLSSEGTALKTVVEYAKEQDKATGIVVTSSITHATPAAFATHVNDRDKETIIAEQLAQSGVDVLLGGGWSFFVPNTVAGSQRPDHRDLLADMRQSTHVVMTKKEFKTLSDVDSLVGLFAREGLPKVEQRQPSLSDMTQKAIEILSKNKKGFFLMVEGSQIDWAGHKNNESYLISEMVDFDNTIGVALAFAKENTDTLVVVTSDHETGGFAIHDGSVQQRVMTKTDFTRTSHTAEMVPVFSYGPGALEFSGIADNTKIGKILIGYLRHEASR
ncbi:MAG: alkaline phosphatase [Gammaproteobacteria bacterium]|nr:alkaline phosphatase [Gammaproteobacteria bacterium]